MTIQEITTTLISNFNSNEKPDFLALQALDKLQKDSFVKEINSNLMQIIK